MEFMKTFSRIMYGVFGIMLLAIVMLLFAPQIPVLSNHLDIKIVQSGSMEPSIMTGSIVFVRQSEAYKPGDVITFTSSGSDIPTTHRIVEVLSDHETTQFMTKGDANEEVDAEPVSEEAVLGKVVLDVPYVGFVLDFARQPWGFALLIVLPAFLIIFDEIDKIFREVRRMRRTTASEELPEAEAPSPVASQNTRKRMMEINHPVYMLTGEGIINVHTMLPVARNEYSKLFLLSVTFILIILMMSFSTVGSTVSYFSDVETSSANALMANALDFTAQSNGTSFTFIEGVLDNPEGLITFVAPEAESTALAYGVRVELVSDTGTFCDALQADTIDPFTYSGKLLDLNASGTPILFNTSWTLDVSLGNGTYVSGDMCVVDLIYTAWNVDVDETSGGYEDEERIQLTFTAPAAPIVPLVDLVEPAGFVADEPITETDPTVPPEEQPVTPAETDTETPTEEIVEEEAEVEEPAAEPEVEEVPELEEESEEETSE